MEVIAVILSVSILGYASYKIWKAFDEAEKRKRFKL